MTCQFCNKDKTDKVFYINWTGTVYQIPVCNECLQKMWQRAVSSGQAEAFKKYTGWWPGKREPRRLGDRAFPETAVDGLVKRRKLAALRVRLAEAAERENYEEAAKIRDGIATIEKEVCTHGN